MDRRLFLTGMLGVAGAAAVGTLSRPGSALAGVPETRGGILDALDTPATDEFGDDFTGDGADAAELEPVQYRRRRRRQRRRVWRRTCRRVWYRGRRRLRCYRRRVWIWFRI